MYRPPQVSFLMTIANNISSPTYIPAIGDENPEEEFPEEEKEDENKQ